MLWGFFKKVVIADRLAEYVNQFTRIPETTPAPRLPWRLIASPSRSTAISPATRTSPSGSARVMGFDLMQNFNLPYLARSISEFWQRWHISLSTWFRDYLYIPLGGSRVTAVAGR